MAAPALPDELRTDCIEFATLRPAGAGTSTLERRVVVTGPPVVAALSESGDVRLLAALVQVLEDPQRAWAAQVMLSALTGREEKIVESFVACPQQWWSSLGTGAQRRWQEWLERAGPDLRWDAREKVFRRDA